jgi:hypothetical protein
MDDHDAAYQAAIAAARAITGADTPAAAKVGRARQASERGACAGCGRELEPAEPVWSCMFSYRGPLGMGGAWTAAPVCGPCYEQRTQWGGRVHRLAGWHSQWAITGAWPCQGCGRQVHAHARQMARYCSQRCVRQASRQRRHRPPTERACDGCGRAFTGRADAVYCSSACRQRAYRQRTSAAAPS